MSIYYPEWVCLECDAQEEYPERLCSSERHARQQARVLSQYHDCGCPVVEVRCGRGLAETAGHAEERVGL